MTDQILADAGLQSQQTVERALVHKLAVSEVFLTDFSEVAGEFFVAAQWPRRHWFFGAPSVRLDPLLVMETFRQAWILAAHTWFSVPLSSHVVMEEIGVDVKIGSLPSASAPPSALLRLSTVQVTRRRAGDASQLELTADITSSAIGVGRAWGRATLLPDAAYHRVRASQRGAERIGDPLVGMRPVEVDLEHPVFFDHPNDHVPGMLLISAACEAARIDQPLRIQALFNQYFELDRVTWMDATGIGPGSAQVRFHQVGQCGAEVEIRPATDP